MASDGVGAASPDVLVVALLADPGLPVTTARSLADELPDVLSRRVSRDVTWKVEVLCERLVVDESGHVQLARVARALESDAQYDMVIGITDEVRRNGLRPIVGEVDRSNRVALASLPALGAMRLRRRGFDVVVRLVDELTRERLGAGANDGEQGDREGRRRRMVVPVRRVTPTGGEGAVQFLSAGGPRPVRLLAGMVRANRPWRLVPALSTAFAGALATGAYVLVSANIWRLADALGPLRLAVAMVFAVAAMVVWLIVDHELWERPATRAARRQATLYNTSTVITLLLGVLCLYAGVFVLSAVAGGFVLDGHLLEEELRHPVDLRDYLTIAWMASSMATVGGALGSGLASDEAVRQATYGYRKRQRST
jgi:hypothetical protein